MNLLNDIEKVIKERFGATYTVEELEHPYQNMQWPKHFAMMKFDVKAYRIHGFGQIMIMKTKMMKMMELVTISLMPFEKSLMPYLLIDTMSMGKKRIMFVEYYDCNDVNLECEELKKISSLSEGLNEYKEKDHWYVSLRTPYSIIKCGKKTDSDIINDIVYKSIINYQKLSLDFNQTDEGIKLLALFRERMIKDGNPSTNTLNKVLGKNEARTFFCKMVMPFK